MHKVIIDGVEYVPVNDAIANSMAIKKGLLMEFYGECSDEMANILSRDSNIKVLVHDWDEGGVSIDEVLVNITEVIDGSG